MLKAASINPGVIRTVLITTLLLVVAGCGDRIGAPCDFQGSGFTASDNCRYRCLEHRTITCPDGADISPMICSGKRDCEPGSCAAGQVCYHVNDPFNKESYCLPAEVCGNYSAGALSAWEQTSFDRSAATLAEWAEKKARRTGKISAPAEPVQPDP